MQTKRVDYDPGGYRMLAAIEGREIGRASCRERV